MKNRRICKILTTLFIQTLIILCVSFVVGEIYLRASHKIDSWTLARMKEGSLEYEPAVFARHVFPQKEQNITVLQFVTPDGSPVHDINEKGYRGKSFETKKPEGITRVMVYGGSAAFNAAVTQGQDWPSKIQRNLADAGHTNVEVINAGIPGHASFDSFGRLFAEGHHFNPDYVILYNAWNDIKNFSSPEFLLREMKPLEIESNPMLDYQNGIDRFFGERLYVYVFLRQLYLKNKFDVGLEGAGSKNEKGYKIYQSSLDQFKLNIEMFVDCARNVGAEPILMTQGTLLRKGHQLGGEKRLKYAFAMFTPEIAFEAMRKADEIIKTVAKEKSVSLIDAGALMTEKDRYLFIDHIHLTPSGSNLLAKIVSDYLTDSLQD